MSGNDLIMMNQIVDRIHFILMTVYNDGVLSGEWEWIMRKLSEMSISSDDKLQYY